MQFSDTVWGGLHALLQIVSLSTQSHRDLFWKKIGVCKEHICYKIWQRSFVFLEVMVTWIVFRCHSLSDAVHYISCMLLGNRSTQASLSIPCIEMCIILIACILLLVVSIQKEHKPDCFQSICKKWYCWFFCCMILILSLLIFGIYGPDFNAGSFIYAGF